MNNYEYIIASLPVLSQNTNSAQDNGYTDSSEIIEFISEQLKDSDRKLLNSVLDGFDSKKLDENYYKQILKSKDSFVHSFFLYDLRLRNLKVQYLNQELSRPDDKDCLLLDQLKEDEESDAQIRAVLERKDILARERGIDELLWDKIDDITLGELFSLDVILGFVAKLQIVDRWRKLNPQTGQEFLRKLVGQIRSTYDNKKNTL